MLEGEARSTDFTPWQPKLQQANVSSLYCTRWLIYTDSDQKAAAETLV